MKLIKDVEIKRYLFCGGKAAIYKIRFGRILEHFYRLELIYSKKTNIVPTILEELFSCDEQKIIKVVDCLPEGGIVHDLIAFAQQRIEAFHEQIANAGRREVKVIKYILVKWGALTTSLYKPLPKENRKPSPHCKHYKPGYNK